MSNKTSMNTTIISTKSTDISLTLMKSTLKSKMVLKLMSIMIISRNKVWTADRMKFRPSSKIPSRTLRSLKIITPCSPNMHRSIVTTNSHINLKKIKKSSTAHHTSPATSTLTKASPCPTKTNQTPKESKSSKTKSQPPNLIKSQVFNLHNKFTETLLKTLRLTKTAVAP